RGDPLLAADTSWPAAVGEVRDPLLWRVDVSASPLSDAAFPESVRGAAVARAREGRPMAAVAAMGQSAKLAARRAGVARCLRTRGRHLAPRRARARPPARHRRVAAARVRPSSPGLQSDGAAGPDRLAHHTARDRLLVPRPRDRLASSRGPLDIPGRRPATRG